MISIEKIFSHIPNNNYKIIDRYQKINENFLNNKIGSYKLPRFTEKDNVVNFCYELTKKSKIKKYLNKLKLIILCTQNPDNGGLPHNSAILHGKLSLKNEIATLDISQGCAGYMYGLLVAQSFLKNDEYCFFYTCDPYSKIIKKNDLNTDILFGDAATLSVLKKGNKKEKKLKYFKFYSYGNDHDAIINKDNLLQMKGKNVMNFCEREVVKSINNFIKEKKLNIKNIKHFYFHQGSRHIVDLLSKKLNIKNKKMSYVPNIGNTVSSSIPILMEKSNFKKKDNFLICGFGVGLSISIGYFS